SGIPLDEGTLNAIVVILITVVLSFFTLIFGELVPKRIAMQKAEPLALALSGLVSGFSVVFSPIVSVLTICTNLILRLLGLDPNAVEEHHSKEDLQMMVDWGSQKGLFDCDTKEIISHALAFNDITVGEFSTHRTDIDILWTHQTTQDWARIILDTRHTRYPVCHETVDQVVGILDARDFFTMLTATVPEMLEALVKPAAFVLETLKADQLFKQMKGTRNYYAVVLDQHGGFRGVVTIRDLLEQLVGSIAPEGEATFIESLGPHLWRVRGSAHLEEVSRTLGVSLPHHQYETFGAYVFGLYGSIPPDGETFALTTDSLTIRVDTIQNHKLVSATVTRLDPS
ncbi:MAG: HlyC/CorC family transporter, partial [Ruminiclostridium sp.]|nr:HlyC/CorC family transporter [Ruminiclostridium sp.]